jgi:hypothetical protein
MEKGGPLGSAILNRFFAYEYHREKRRRSKGAAV